MVERNAALIGKEEVPFRKVDISVEAEVCSKEFRQGATRHGDGEAIVASNGFSGEVFDEAVEGRGKFTGGGEGIDDGGRHGGSENAETREV